MRMGHVLGVIAALLGVSGCAAIHRHEAASTEQLLAAAGFQMRAADSPARIQDLNTMPPLKIVARSRGNDVTYTLADPYKCRCLYVGGAAEYSAYQRLVTDEQIAREQMLTERETMDWALWGPRYWE